MSCFGEGGESQGMNASCLRWASQNSAAIPIFYTCISSTFDLAFNHGPRDGPQARGSSHQCRETWPARLDPGGAGRPHHRTTSTANFSPASLVQEPPTPAPVPRYGGQWLSVTGALESKSGFALVGRTNLASAFTRSNGCRGSLR